MDKNTDIPHKDHIARYIAPSKVYDFDNCEVDAEAFKLKVKEHSIEAISINWIEFLQLNDRVKEIIEISKVLKNKNETKSLAKNSCLAVLNVGSLKSNIKNSIYRRVIGVRHKKSRQDKSHGQITNIKKDDNEEFLDLLAEEVIELHRIKEYINTS